MTGSLKTLFKQGDHYGIVRMFQEHPGLYGDSDAVEILNKARNTSTKKATLDQVNSLLDGPGERELINDSANDSPIISQIENATNSLDLFIFIDKSGSQETGITMWFSLPGDMDQRKYAITFEFEPEFDGAEAEKAILGSTTEELIEELTQKLPLLSLSENVITRFTAKVKELDINKYRLLYLDKPSYLEAL